jgi:cholesterol transport system auxiliary component
MSACRAAPGKRAPQLEQPGLPDAHAPRRTRQARTGRCTACLACLAVSLLAGCSTLNPTATAPPVFYTFDSGPARARTVAAPAAAPVLAVTPTRAAAGFDSQRIIYLRETQQLAYFAHSEWVEPPARMLASLLVAVLARSAEFRAVVLSGGSAAADYRLDTELVRMQQDFRTVPSQVLLELRATLVDEKTRRVLAVRQFSAQVSATTDDARGGAVAANSAVQQVLDEVARFCGDTVATRAPAP